MNRILNISETNQLLLNRISNLEHNQKAVETSVSSRYKENENKHGLNGYFPHKKDYKFTIGTINNFSIIQEMQTKETIDKKNLNQKSNDELEDNEIEEKNTSIDNFNTEVKHTQEDINQDLFDMLETELNYETNESNEVIINVKEIGEVPFQFIKLDPKENSTRLNNIISISSSKAKKATKKLFLIVKDLNKQKQKYQQRKENKDLSIDFLGNKTYRPNKFIQKTINFSSNKKLIEVKV